MIRAVACILFAALGATTVYAQIAPPSPSSTPSPLGGTPGSQSTPLGGNQGPQSAPLDTEQGTPIGDPFGSRDFERAEPVPEPPEPYDPMTDQGRDDPTRPQPQAPAPNPMPPPQEPPVGVDPEGNVEPLDRVPDVPEPSGMPEDLPQDLPAPPPNGASTYELGRPDPVRD